MAKKVSIRTRVMSALGSLRELEGGLEHVRSSGRVLGFVVSPSFNGLDHRERQDLISRRLRAALSPQELELVGPIVAFTPREARIKRELSKVG